jgi:hypothetical protein
MMMMVVVVVVMTTTPLQLLLHAPLTLKHFPPQTHKHPTHTQISSIPCFTPPQPQPTTTRANFA